MALPDAPLSDTSAFRVRKAAFARPETCGAMDMKLSAGAFWRYMRDTY
jgi:hypothetical protein